MGFSAAARADETPWLSLNNLALIHKERGDYDRAIELYRRSLAIAERIVGPNHPDLLVTLNNLAVLYETSGQKAEADAVYRRIRRSGHAEWAERIEERASRARQRRPGPA
jgi:tetratricopeptide (TPR) repeat protein